MADDDDWGLLAELQENELSGKVQNLQVEEKKPPESKPSVHKEEKPVVAGANTGAPVQNAKASGVKEKDNSDEPDVSLAEKSLMTKVLRDHLLNVESDVEVLQKDPNSPLFSAKSFEELNLSDELLKGVYEMGFNKPSKIQETALPMCLADPPSNMIAQSQSGTGKTAAFVLSMLNRVDSSKPYPQALCLSPTYELALQIGSVVEKMGKYLIEKGMQVVYAVKGARHPKGTKLSDHIIIGTPGTVLDWIMKYRLFDAKKIKIFVLDEADVMISTQGHQDQSLRTKKYLPRECQVLLFSATYEDKVMNFARSIVPDPIVIRLRREEETLDNIKQFYIMCENAHKKFEALANLYAALTIGQSMVFCHTRKSASWLAEKMSKDGHAVALLTGELDIDQRLAVLNRFRDGKEKVLITTNLMARGIDVDQVTIVVNYDIPVDQFGRPDVETYLHRIGRTGRFGKTGLAINFCSGPKFVTMIGKIADHFGKQIELLCVDDVDELEKLQKLAK